MQADTTVDDPGFLAHWATCRLEPANPPMRVWTSHMPDGEPLGDARFHSISTAPGTEPCVPTTKSDISTCPDWPDVEPTCSTGLGELMSDQYDPVAMRTG